MDTAIEEHDVNGEVEHWVVLTPGLESEDENDSGSEKSEYGSDDDAPLADIIPLAGLAGRGESNEEHTYRWRKGRPPAAKNFSFKGDEELHGYENLIAPIDYFRKFFDDQMVARIVNETNLYSTQCNVNRGSISTCPEEIEHFLGILLQMCIVQMPRYRMYWQSSTRYEQVANIMSRDRFELIKRFLHFEDNSNAPDPKDPNKDKLFKVRKLFEMLRQNCLKVKPEEHNSVDEQMIPFKGRSSLRRYLPKKPKKWGFKVFSRNGVSGFCYDFILDGAPDPSREECDSIGFVSGDIVLRLCSTLPRQMSYKAYFDNYFTFLELLQKLKEWGIWAVGTMRQDRMRGCELKEEKVLKKEGRGAFDAAVDLNSGLTIVRWFDNRQVQFASNYAYTEPVEAVRRWSSKEKKHIDVTRPAVVQIYNAGMFGVDLFDMFMALYRLHHRSKKGYMRIFFWILATSVTNGWCLYKRICAQNGIKVEEQKDLLEFTSDVASSLSSKCIPTRRGRGRPSTDTSLEQVAKIPRKAPTSAPNEDIRFDGFEHWPEHRSNRPRCMNCGEKTRVGCSKCNVGLCLTAERNCFKEFHV